MFALTRGDSPAFIMNGICLALQRDFPGVTLRLVHIPGMANPADKISRGEDLSVDDWVEAVTLARDVLETTVGHGISFGSPSENSTFEPTAG